MVILPTAVNNRKDVQDVIKKIVKISFLHLYNSNLSKASYKNLEKELQDQGSQSFNPIIIVELDRVFNSLDPKKAPGLDKISDMLLKYVYTSTKSFLLQLLNSLLEYG